MGVNNRQRRAATKKRARERGGPSTASGAWSRPEPELTRADVRALLVEVVAAVGDGAAADRARAVL